MVVFATEFSSISVIPSDVHHIFKTPSDTCKSKIEQGALTPTDTKCGLTRPEKTPGSINSEKTMINSMDNEYVNCPKE